MKITIETNNLKHYGLNLADFLYLLLANECNSSYDCISGVKDRLILKGLLRKTETITVECEDIINEILKESELVIKERNVDDLVIKLQELWPAGYKDNKYRWKCNKTDVKKKLYKFFKEYGEDYTDEQIINAAKRYVEQFNNTGDRRFQKLLKYFIMKEDGSSESDLATNLESIVSNEIVEQQNYDATLF